MLKPIAPGSKDYHNSLNKYRQLQAAFNKMNNNSIGGTKRGEAARTASRLINQLRARGYCPTSKPA